MTPISDPLTRILVTGGTGFVGRHLIRSLQRRFPSAVLFAVGRCAIPADGAAAVAADLTEAASVSQLFARLRPDAVIHLAGATHVELSAGAPDWAWKINLNGTLNLLDAIAKETPNAALIHVSSGEVYGMSANEPGEIREGSTLQPANHYAVTKAAADLAVGEAALRGLKAIRFRPFNHTGPGQAENFVVPHIAAQIARAEAGRGPQVIKIGRTDRSRDFLDVRDVVEAYGLCLEKIEGLPSGSVINLASGRSRSVQWILNELIKRARIPMTVDVDAGKIRSNDVAEIRADASRARDWLKWSPIYPLESSLEAVLAYWREIYGDK